VSLANRTVRSDNVLTVYVDYNLRMTNVAMSVTFNLKSHLTKAIYFGCTPNDKDEFAMRVNNAGNTTRHPMLSVGLFTERQKRWDFLSVNLSITKMNTHVVSLGQPLRIAEQSASMDLVQLWMKIRYLSSRLETWKQQILKMITHIDELAHTLFQYQLDLVKEGKIIKERLMDIVIEYDDMCRKCNLVTDGASLAIGIVSETIMKT
jgi:hypothetical protein